MKMAISPLAGLFGLLLWSHMLEPGATAGESQTMPRYGIVIHGGAGGIRRNEVSAAQEKEYRAALAKALAAGYHILEEGGTSLDAVCAAVVELEDSPLFNAGRGAVLTSAGKAELDASIMEGRTLAAGGVAGVQRIKNPILLSRAVMEKSPHVLLGGAGAENFAASVGFQFVLNDYFITPQRREQLRRVQQEQNNSKPTLKRGRAARSLDDAMGTVGAVALDQLGNLAAATSTGGRVNKSPGRIGDSPITGAGNYANNLTCAVSGTGHGEYFQRAVATHDVSALMEYGGRTLQQATSEVLKKIAALGGEGGFIAIDRHGNIALPFNSAGMFRAHQRQSEPAVVEMFGNAEK